MKRLMSLVFLLAMTGPSTSDINWTGNWAFGCDFQSNNISNAQIIGSDCSGRCAATQGCTHFTWTMFNGGTCWMKSGVVSKGDAFATGINSMVCGVLVASQSTSDPNVQQSIVDAHNALRRKIQTTATFQLSWDANAGNIAQQWARNCQFRHPSSAAEVSQYLRIPGLSCGQNIAMGSSPSMTWSDAINMWYNEVKDFVFGQDSGKTVGHFTQIVWNTTFKIGCGFALCNAGTSNQFNFYVCDYCPAGNISPNQFSPYEAGTPCKKCPNACNNGLCTNPCPVTNYYSNCDSQLFPSGCANAPNYLASFKQYCNATCQCKGTKLY